MALGLIDKLREATRKDGTEAGLIVASDELNKRLREAYGDLPERNRLDSVPTLEAYNQGKEIQIRPAVRTDQQTPARIGHAG